MVADATHLSTVIPDRCLKRFAHLSEQMSLLLNHVICYRVANVTYTYANFSRLHIAG